MRFKEYLVEWSTTSPKIKKKLVAKGYKYLGKGVDQTAYLEPKTGKVLKIFGTAESERKTTKSGFSKDHYLFKNWVSYCESHNGNEFLPKFDGWESFELDGEKYLQIRMERLQKLPSDLGDCLQDLANRLEVPRGEQKAAIQKIMDDVGKGAESTNSKYMKGVYDELSKLAILLGDKGLRQLLETIAELYTLAKKNGYTFDLHGGNFMHRNDGIPVIVDPWVV